MGDDDPRMCSLRGTENRGLDIFNVPKPPENQSRLTPEAAKWTKEFLGESYLPTAADARADLARAEAELKQILDDSGITAEELAVLVAYVRDMASLGIDPSDEDLENVILSRRPQKPRFPGTTDPRAYSLWGLRPLAFFSNPTVQTTISLAVDFIPYLGEVKMLYESISGRDAITGDEIPMWARILGPVTLGIGKAGKALKVLRAGAKIAGEALRVGIRRLGPLVMFAALTGKAPAEAFRVLDNIATMDKAAVKAALVEAKAARGALEITSTQAKALKEVGRLVPAADVAKIEQKAARRARAMLDEAPTPKPKTPAPTPDALPVGEAARKVRPRKPAKGKGKAKGKSKPKPKAVKAAAKAPKRFNMKVSRAAKALKRLKTRGLQEIPLSDWFKKQDFGKYQIAQAGGKETEYIGTLKSGKKVQIDNLADSVSEPGRLDVIEMKFSNPYIDSATIESSGHLRFASSKADQLTRLGRFAAENSKDVAKVKVLASSATAAEIYLNILNQLVPKNLRKYIEVLDEELKAVSKKSF